MSQDLSQSLGDDFEYVQFGGTAQFSTVHILKSPDGYTVVHELPIEIGRRLSSISAIIDTVHRISSLDARLLGIDRVGTTKQGSLFWASAVINAGSLYTAQSKIDFGEVFSADHAAQIGRELCSILGTLHLRGKVHGAITPATVIIADGSIYLSEGGIEFALRTAGINTTDFPAALQSHQISPEQLANQEPTPQSDIYALGVTLYELITGKPPFGGRTTAMVMASVLTDENAPETVTGGQEPGSVVQAILRAIEKDPADRWTSVEQFSTALDEASTSSSLPVPVTARSSPVGCIPLITLITATGYGIHSFLS